MSGGSTIGPHTRRSLLKSRTPPWGAGPACALQRVSESPTHRPMKIAQGRAHSTEKDENWQKAPEDEEARDARAAASAVPVISRSRVQGTSPRPNSGEERHDDEKARSAQESRGAENCPKTRAQTTVEPLHSSLPTSAESLTKITDKGSRA